MEFLAISKRGDSKDWKAVEKSSARAIKSDKVYAQTECKKWKGKNKIGITNLKLYIGHDICDLLDFPWACHLLVMTNKKYENIIKFKKTDNISYGYKLYLPKCSISQKYSQISFKIPKELKINKFNLSEVNFDLLHDKSLLIDFNNIINNY